jgi:hypothetical protein
MRRTMCRLISLIFITLIVTIAAAQRPEKGNPVAVTHAARYSGHITNYNNWGLFGIIGVIALVGLTKRNFPQKN